MAVLLKTVSVRVCFIQIMQVSVQNKGKSVWKSRYVGDVSAASTWKGETDASGLHGGDLAVGLAQVLLQCVAMG